MSDCPALLAVDERAPAELMRRWRFIQLMQIAVPALAIILYTADNQSRAILTGCACMCDACVLPTAKEKLANCDCTRPVVGKLHAKCRDRNKKLRLQTDGDALKALKEGELIGGAEVVKLEALEAKAREKADLCNTAAREGAQEVFVSENAMYCNKPVTISHDGFGMMSFIYAAHILQWVMNGPHWPQKAQEYLPDPGVPGEYALTDIVRGGPAAFEWVRGVEANAPSRILAMVTWLRRAPHGHYETLVPNACFVCFACPGWPVAAMAPTSAFHRPRLGLPKHSHVYSSTMSTSTSTPVIKYSYSRVPRTHSTHGVCIVFIDYS